MEIWKDIPNLYGFQASNLGRIRTLDRVVDYGNRKCNRKGKILKPHKSKVGYYTVAPFQKTTTIHKLIALTFLGNKPENSVIDHINGDYLDNRADNLRYVTQKENVHNALRLGKILTGEKCSWSKLKEKDVISIRNDKRTLCEISKEYNICRSTIAEIKNNIIWKHINNNL